METTTGLSSIDARETANLIGSDEVEGTAVYATDGSKIAGEGARLRIPASVSVPDVIELYFPARDEYSPGRILTCKISASP